MQSHRISSIHDERYQSVINILIQARKERGVSQAALAEALGFSQPDISKIERFERRLDITEFLDFLMVISEGDMEFFNQTWMSINECHRRSKKSK